MREELQQQSSSDTAHMEWDRLWRTESGRAGWLSPEEDVRALVPELLRRGSRRVLDLGCGVGRHSLFLAEQGFEVSAVDASPQAVTYTGEAALAAGLSLEVGYSMMTDLRYEKGCFDYVLAWNVIYHGNTEVVLKTLAEIKRVLRPGGLFQGTMLTKRNAYFGRGEEIDKNTFISSEDEEKSHPHFFCSAGELVSLLDWCELLSLRQKEHDKPGSHHWHFTAEEN